MKKTTTLTKDDLLKIKASALYVISKISPIDFHKLFKILYLADRDHYAVYGSRIIDDSFIPMDKGPVPSVLYDALKVAKGTQVNPTLSFIANSFKVDGYYAEGIEEPDMDELSKTDIICLNKSIRENAGLRMSTLTRKSHDIAWRQAREKGSRTIDTILMAKAGGSSDEMLGYLKEMEEINAILA